MTIETEKRGSLSHLRKPVRLLQSLPQRDREAQRFSELEVVIVHGCWDVSPTLAASLYRTAEHIEQRVQPRRVRIFSYNTAKLLQRGKKTFDQLWDRLLMDVDTILKASPPQLRFAFVAHGTGAWVVRKAIVEWQWMYNPGNLPCALVEYSLPPQDWDIFHTRSLRFFGKEPRLDMLSQELIQATAQEFHELISLLGSQKKKLPQKEIKPSDGIGITESDRTATGVSNFSDSSAESNENAEIGHVKVRTLAENRIVSFLQESALLAPTEFPQLPIKAQTRSISTMRQMFAGRGRNSSPSNMTTPREQRREAIVVPQTPNVIATESTPVTSPSKNVALGLEARRSESSTTPLPKPIIATENRPQKSVVIEDPKTTSEDTMSLRESNNLCWNLNKDDEILKYNKRLAKEYFQRGDFDEASRLYDFLLRLYSEASRVDKGYYRMRLFLAQIAWFKGNYKDSERAILALHEDPELVPVTIENTHLVPETIRWLALARWKQGRYGDAVDVAEQCRKSISGDSFPLFSSTLALVLASVGSFKRAWIISTKAVTSTLEKQQARAASRTNGTQVGPVMLAKDNHLDPDYRSCLLNHARISSEMGKIKTALDANQLALDDMQKQLGPTHFATLDSASLRAGLKIYDANATGAGEEILRTLRQMRERLGEDHPSTLQAVQTLVLRYRSEGRYSDAEQTASYLVDRCDRSNNLGPEHPQTLKSKRILAEVLLALGKWQEAENTQREVLGIKNGEQNPFFRTTLATILRTRGDWDQAATEANEVLAGLFHKFGKEDAGDEGEETPYQGETISVSTAERLLRMPSRISGSLALTKGSTLFKDLEPIRVYPSLLHALHCVALCEQVRDDANLAFVHEVLQLLHQILDRRLGSTHRLTISLWYDVAVNHRLRGEFQEALDAIETVLRERREALGSDHPDYLIARHQRAVILFRLSHWEKALREQETTLKVQEYLLGDGHADAVISRFTLSGIYLSLGRLQEAKSLIVRVIREQRQLYNKADNGTDHPIVLRSRARHALICLDSGDLACAEEEQASVYSRRRAEFEEHHILTRNAKNNLAQIKQAMHTAQSLQEAEKMYLELDASSQRQEHTSIVGPTREAYMDFQVRSNLASYYYEVGQLEQAEPIQKELLKALLDNKAALDTDERLITSTFNLALTQKGLKKYEAACKLLYSAVSKASSILGDKHPQTMELQTTLAKWLLDFGIMVRTPESESLRTQTHYTC